MTPESASAFALVMDPVFDGHIGPEGHPECPERTAAVQRGIARSGFLSSARRIPVRPATTEELTGVHRPDYVERVLSLLQHASEGHLDGDTFFSSGTRAAALCAAGAGIDLALTVHARTAATGFAAIRPPGHHATAGRAMGFCIFNNIAIAAEQLLRRTDARRIAIIDWDVHHGNGTQDIFYERDDVLFISMHQWPHYPGSGIIGETGRGNGIGRTVNIPFPARTGTGDYLSALQRVVVPLCRAFQPDHIMVSTGFDAHRDDWLASMELEPAGYGAMTAITRRLAEETCAGRMTLFLEGGYHLNAIADCVAATVAAATKTDIHAPDIPSAPTENGSRLIDRVIDAISPFWNAFH